MIFFFLLKNKMPPKIQISFFILQSIGISINFGDNPEKKTMPSILTTLEGQDKMEEDYMQQKYDEISKETN